jgi:hypothetical protein
VQLHVHARLPRPVGRARRPRRAARGGGREPQLAGGHGAQPARQAAQGRQEKGTYAGILDSKLLTLSERKAITKVVISFSKSLINRFQHLAEGARLQAQLQSSLTLLAKTKEKYEKAFGASERALDGYQRADADLNLSRAEVEKQRMNSTIKSQQCDDAKNEYANQVGGNNFVGCQ